MGDDCDNDSDGDGIDNATDNCDLVPNLCEFLVVICCLCRFNRNF